MKKQKRDVYQEVTDQIIELLERGVRPWSQRWNNTGGNALAGAGLPLRSNGQPYQGINVLLLWIAQDRAGYESPQWMTFKQAKAIGANVRKGEKGTSIVFFSPIERENKKTGEKEKFAVVKSYCVFNLDQIENLPERYQIIHPENVTPDIELPDNQNACDVALYASGAVVKHGGDRAFYRPSDDSVHMPRFEQFKSPDAYTATLAHELIHWTGSEKRLKRDLKNSFGTTDYAKEELVAELGAAFTCARFGVAAESREDHASYLASWLKALRNDKKCIMQAAAKAQAATNYLFEQIELGQESDAAKAA